MAWNLLRHRADAITGTTSRRWRGAESPRTGPRRGHRVALGSHTEDRVSLCSSSEIARASSINCDASSSVRKLSRANNRGSSASVVECNLQVGQISLETNLFRCEYETHVSPHAVGPRNKTGLDAGLRAVSRQFGAAPYRRPAPSLTWQAAVSSQTARHSCFEGSDGFALAAGHLDVDRIFRRAVRVDVED